MTALFAMMLASSYAVNRVVTLHSTQGDQLEVSYSIVYDNGTFVIQFTDVQKILSRSRSGRHPDLREYKLAFFDRRGNYDVRFDGIAYDVLLAPADADYTPTPDGYLFVDERSPLPIKVSMHAANQSFISFPMYLVHRKGKKRYEVLCSCGNLEIELNKSKAQQRHASNRRSGSGESETIMVTEELEAGIDAEREAELRVMELDRLLQQQTAYPFPELLKDKYHALDALKYKVKDAGVMSRIDEVLREYERLERQLSQEQEMAIQRQAEAAEQKAKEEARKAEARQDSIMAAQQKAAAKEKKFSMWMLIAAVVLAALFFVGNQVFQHFRNLRNQRSMMEMQAGIAKRAENEAKRRAQNTARMHANQAVNSVRHDGAEAMKNSIKKCAASQNKKKI